MDADQTWNDLLIAYATKDWDAALQHAIELLEWLDKKGFPPHLTTGSTTGQFTCQLDDEWNRALAYSACNVVIERAEQEVLS